MIQSLLMLSTAALILLPFAPQAPQDPDTPEALVQAIESAVGGADRAFAYRTRQWSEMAGLKVAGRREGEVTVGARIGRPGLPFSRPFVIAGTETEGVKKVQFRAAFDGQDLVQVFHGEKVVRSVRLRSGEWPGIPWEASRNMVSVESLLLPGLGGTPIGLMRNSELSLGGRAQVGDHECLVLVVRRLITSAADSVLPNPRDLVMEFRISVDARSFLPRRSERRMIVGAGDAFNVHVIELLGEVRELRARTAWGVEHPAQASARDFSTPRPAPALAVGDEAPPLRVLGDDLRGKVVVLDFWSTWYGPSLADLAALQNVHVALAERGACVIGVSFEETREVDPAEVMHAHGATYPCLTLGGPIADAFGVTERPARVVIDADGKIAALLLDPEPKLAQRLTELIDPLLSKR